MYTNGFCNYVHMDKFGRVDKEKARRKAGAEVKLAGKRPSDRSGEGTGEKDNGLSEGAGPASRRGR